MAPRAACFWAALYSAGSPPSTQWAWQIGPFSSVVLIEHFEGAACVLLLCESPDTEREFFFGNLLVQST